MSLKWRKNQQVSSGRLLLSRTRLLADINHLCKSRLKKKSGRISEKLFFTSFLEQIHYGKNLGRTMVFLNKKRNGFMKRNVLVIVSQQSSSMRNIKKISPGGVIQRQLFFCQIMLKKKKDASFYQMGLHLVVCGRTNFCYFFLK